MNTVAIIQARMGATRLPGKVLKKILGKPMLELELERILRAKTIDKIVISTTTNPQDDQIIRLTDYLGIPSYRGSETNVLSRYYLTAKKFVADTIVRITGDCPVIDPNIIDKVVIAFKQQNCDYIANTTMRKLNLGMDTEIFTFNTLQKIWKQATSPYDREHVTPYIYTHPKQFVVKGVSLPKKFIRSGVRLTVDEADDFKLIKKIYQSLYPKNPHFTLLDVYKLLDKQPQLKAINRFIQQKPLLEA